MLLLPNNPSQTKWHKQPASYYAHTFCGSRPSGHGLPWLCNVGGLCEEDLKCWEGQRWLGVLHSPVWGQPRVAQRPGSAGTTGQSTCSSLAHGPGFACPGSWVPRVSVSRARVNSQNEAVWSFVGESRTPQGVTHTTLYCLKLSTAARDSRGGDMDSISPWYVMR